MKPENRLWTLKMLRAIQETLESEGIEDLRTDDEIGDKLEDLIATVEDDGMNEPQTGTVII